MQSRSRECKITGSSNNAGGTLFMKDSKYNIHFNMEQVPKGKNNKLQFSMTADVSVHAALQ